MSIKLRVNQLRIEDRARAKGLFNKLKAESLTVTAVTASHFVTAARFAEHYATGLRAGDALHVAIAAEVGAKICTLDKGLAEGATTLGVSVELV
jgi:predicted nucleic acid-binding protein